MSKLYSLMSAFHAAILERDKESFAPHILPNPRLSAQARMAIYIEGYRLRLLDAIKSDYPATLALLDDRFDALASAFIEQNPPTQASLDPYPHPFAAYLRAHSDDAFAADLADLECAIAGIFLLPESEALTPAHISGITPEAFGAMRLMPRTASRLLRFDYPVDAYLTRQRSGETPERPTPATSYLYVVRHEHEVRRYPLSQAEFLVLQQLANGLPVGAALEQVAETYPQLLPDIAANVQSWFGAWTGSGFFRSDHQHP